MPDAAKPEKQALPLAKLTLLLAHDPGDAARVQGYIEAAYADLDV